MEVNHGRVGQRRGGTKMIVEVFEKGSDYKNFENIYFVVTGIVMNDGKYILTMESRPNAVINAREYELRVSY